MTSRHRARFDPEDYDVPGRADAEALDATGGELDPRPVAIPAPRRTPTRRRHVRDRDDRREGRRDYGRNSAPAWSGAHYLERQRVEREGRHGHRRTVNDAELGPRTEPLPVPDIDDHDLADGRHRDEGLDDDLDASDSDPDDADDEAEGFASDGFEVGDDGGRSASPEVVPAPRPGEASGRHRVDPTGRLSRPHAARSAGHRDDRLGTDRPDFNRPRWVGPPRGDVGRDRFQPGPAGLGPVAPPMPPPLLGPRPYAVEYVLVPRPTTGAGAWPPPEPVWDRDERSGLPPGPPHRRRHDGGRGGAVVRVLLAMVVIAALLMLLSLSGALDGLLGSSDGLPPADNSPFGASGQMPEISATELPVPPDPVLAEDLASSKVMPAPGSVAGIPAGVLAAYRGAQDNLARTSPDCQLSWALVAGIGKVESNHARSGAIDPTGTTLTPILGPQLDGTDGNAAIRDTDNGTLDGDTTWDRAVGPTQFIPSTWRGYAVDANNDGRTDPNNVHDAATASGRYLCAGDTDLSDPVQLRSAVLRYNRSEAYVDTVLHWARTYAAGVTSLPDNTGGPTLTVAAGPQPTDLSPPTLSGETAPGPTARRPEPGVPAAAPVNPATPNPARSVPGVPVPTPRGTSSSSAPTPAAPLTTTPSTTPPAAPSSTSAASAPGPSPRPPRPSPRPSTGSTPTRAPTPSAGSTKTPVAAVSNEVCAQLSTTTVGRALGLDPAGLTRRSSATPVAHRCTFSNKNGPVVLLSITESDGNTRHRDRNVMQSGQGGWTLTADITAGRAVLTIPAAAEITAAAAQSGLPALVAHLP